MAEYYSARRSSPAPLLYRRQNTAHFIEYFTAIYLITQGAPRRIGSPDAILILSLRLRERLSTFRRLLPTRSATSRHFAPLIELSQIDIAQRREIIC